MSANTPAGSDSNTMGSVVAVWIRATIVAAFGSSTNSHCAPTACIHVPTPLIVTPSHSQKKARLRSGANGAWGAPREAFQRSLRHVRTPRQGASALGVVRAGHIVDVELRDGQPEHAGVSRGVPAEHGFAEETEHGKRYFVDCVGDD